MKNQKLTVEITLTIEQVAEAFAGFDAEAQARFFELVGKIGETWEEHGSFGDWYQWSTVGRQLRECTCITESGRNMIRAIHTAMEKVPT